jgi:hypothetical protein
MPKHFFSLVRVLFVLCVGEQSNHPFQENYFMEEKMGPH